MNSRDLRRFEKSLRFKRDEVANDLHNLEKNCVASKRDGSRYGIHLAESGNEEDELAKSLTLLEEEGDLLSQIDRALERIEGGVYGVCESCSGSIGKQRLLAKPFARYCIECRRKSENNGDG